MKRWSAMAKAFTKLERHRNGRKEGGPNPDANSRLRAVIRIQRQLICLKKM
jgi:transcriptional/translational regulatory protein YebC/TACO1